MEHISHNWIWKDEQFSSIIDNGKIVYDEENVWRLGNNRGGGGRQKINKDEAFIHRRTELSELILFTNWLLLKLIIVDGNLYRLFLDDLAICWNVCYLPCMKASFIPCSVGKLLHKIIISKLNFWSKLSQI